VKRHYTIGRIKGGMKFSCTRCAHHVSTLDFDARDGNLRTQAATAINQPRHQRSPRTRNVFLPRRPAAHLAHLTTYAIESILILTVAPA
jgi:hypothetical protein